MDDLLRYGAMAVCILVLAAVICRVDQMKKRITRWAWFATYVLYAIYALGVLLDLIAERPVVWYDAAGVGGLVLYMCLTRKRWEGHQDPDTIRSELRRADGKSLGEGAP